VGNRLADGTGAVLQFESKDALKWHYVNQVAASRGRYGKMWECPDLFPLDEKDILLVSPQEMEPTNMEFFPGNGNTLCLSGHIDPKSLELIEEGAQAVDYQDSCIFKMED